MSSIPLPIDRSDRRRRRSGVRFGACAVAVAFGVSGLVAVGPASADPLGDFQGASAELARLQDESSILVDDYNHEADVVDRLRAQIDADTQRQAQLGDYLAQDRDRVRRQAVSVYKYGSAPMVGIQALAGGKSIEEVIRAMRYVAKAQAESNRAYEKLRDDQTAMQTIGERLKQAQADRTARLGRLGDAKTRIEDSIRKQEAITAQYRSQLDAAAMQDTKVAESLLSSGQAPPPPTPEVGRAIEFAKAQVGKPYVWGATGPDTYDCSGLIMTAYRSVGIYLPRTSGEMRAQLFPQATPLPGDIAWHPGHVALYLGAGIDVEAPHTGDVVRYKMVANRFVAFVRPWGPRPAGSANADFDVTGGVGGAGGAAAGSGSTGGATVTTSRPAGTSPSTAAPSTPAPATSAPRQG